jgi:hypothetical protein
MAFKNIFSSAYAIVENINYNGSRKGLSFDLVLYRDSHKEFETGRMTYNVVGTLSTFEIDSVITDVPSGIKFDGKHSFISHEAMPDDFDFDAFDDFKPYLIGNDSGGDFTEGTDEDQTGFQYVCEHKPVPNADGEWPNTVLEEREQIDNPAYDSDNANEFLAAGEVVEVGEGENAREAVGAADGSTPNPYYTPEKIDGDQKVVWHKIRYEWMAYTKDSDNYVFLDDDGDYWIVSGDTGSIDVQQIDKPFLDTDWATWFSATAMDSKDKNLQSQIYTWLKTKPEYKDAVDI